MYCSAALPTKDTGGSRDYVSAEDTELNVAK